MKKLIIIILFSSIVTLGYSQQITGNEEVMPNSYETYYCSSSYTMSWDCSGGTITDYGYNSIGVTWGGSGEGSLFAYSENYEEYCNLYVTILGPPDAPEAYGPYSITSSSFSVNWSSASHATYYYLYVSTSANFSSYDSYYTSSTEYGVTDLSGGTTYYYRVRAFNSVGNSDYSNTESALTRPPVPSTTAASNIGAGSFTANWNSATGASTYQLDVTNVGQYSGISGLSYNIGSLSANTQYRYRVRATNSTGYSDYSGYTYVTTLTSAPSNIYAEDITLNSFNLYWSEVGGATGYRLDISIYSNFSSMLASYNNRLEYGTSLAISGLSASTIYYVRIRSINSDGVPSANSSVYQVGTPPPKPTGLSGGTPSSTSFTASWGSCTGATSYYLDVSTSYYFSSYVLQTSTSSLYYGVTGLSSNTTYYFRVTAYNGSWSETSDVASILTAPAAPTASAGTNQSTTTFVANWGSVSGASSYSVDVSTSSGFGSYNTFSTSYTSVEAYSLTSGTTYYYRVRAINSGGNSSGNSNTITTYTRLAPPTASAATNKTSTSFTANWGSSTGATSYTLDVAKSSDFTNSLNTYTGITSLNYSVTNRDPDTQYYYRVRAVNTNGSSDNSTSTITAWTMSSPPGNISTTDVSTEEFTTLWNSSSGATSYKLDVSTSSSFTSFVGIYNDLTVNGTSQEVTGLSGNTNYYFRLRSVTANGASESSGTTSKLTCPDASSSISASTITSNSLTLSWTAVQGASGYGLDLSLTDDFSSFITGYEDKSVSTNSEAVTGLLPGTTYYFQVRAINASGASDNTASSIITVPAPPVAFESGEVTPTSFTAKWNEVKGAGSYRIDISTTDNFSSYISGYENKTVTDTSENVTGLSSGATYYYMLRAVNSSGTSEESEVFAETTIPSGLVDNNYIKTVTVLAEGVKTSSDLAQSDIWDQATSFSFFDGLGRPIQAVEKSASPGQNDIIQPIVYDQFGRDSLKYLPYSTSASGYFRTDALDDQADFYTNQSNVAHDQYPFAETIFDNSPLNTILEQGTSGSVWQISKTSGVSNFTGNTVRYYYGLNVVNDIYLWICDETNNRPKAASSNKFYGANTLYRTRIYNENAPDTTSGTNWTEEFKDKRGNVVLKRAFDGLNTLSTYYVYDNLGLLRYVIPPITPISTDGSNNSYISAANLGLYCYVYGYDKRQRMVQKRIPGTDTVFMAYDSLDRLVATQDGVQRTDATAANRKWSFTKYDALNRPVLTGTITSPNTRAAMQTLVDGYSYQNEERSATSANHYYTDNAFPNSSITKTYLSVSYFDNYDCNYDGTADYTYATDNDFPNNSALPRILNKPTVTKLRQLDPASGTEVWVTTAVFYDKYYRIIQTQTTGIQGGSEQVTNEINFAGWLIKSKQTQTVVQGTTTLTNTVLTQNDYDHRGRILNTYNKINAGSEKNISSLTYNELGQLITKKLHVTSGTGLQKIDYTYNIRGWLKKINEPDLSGADGDFFGMELLYNEGFTALEGNNQYNGNISGIKWKNGSSGSTQKGYGFVYDGINRLDTARYGEGNDYTTNVGRYNEIMTYDMNGNIQSISRKGQTSTGVFGDLDLLSYSYSDMGNQLRAIADNVTDVAGRDDFYDGSDGNTAKEYFYDRNGNMKLDKNKSLKFEYNILNLPTRVTDTINTSLKTEYVYTAAGQKILQRLSNSTNSKLYFGNIVYALDGSANGISMQYIITPEGRAIYSGGTFTYEYNIKDHLGNTRVTFNVPSSTAVIVQQDDYYPFGMLHKPLVTSNDNLYLYNSKELQEDMNLNWYDYGARFYDPAIGRWNSVDPLAEVNRKWSPYRYAYDNPIRFLDPDGMLEGDPIWNPEVRGNRASNLFGQVRTVNGVPNSQNHQGYDYVAPLGTDALSVGNGTVVAVQTEDIGDYGRSITIAITNDDGSTSYAFYAHLKTVGVEVDQPVFEDDVIGTTGASGNADPSDPHLHFENRTEESPGTGLDGRETPNDIVDTKFYSQDVNAIQTTTGVQKVAANSDGTATTTNMNTDGTTQAVNSADDEER